MFEVATSTDSEVDDYIIGKLLDSIYQDTMEISRHTGCLIEQGVTYPQTRYCASMEPWRLVPLGATL
jgi:hypothetical protein